MSHSYDQLFFESFPNPERHINRIAALGSVIGCKIAPLEGARVLEIGCSTGQNLIPQAYQYPQTTFIGVDVSEKQIEHGNALIAEIGLKNIKLIHQSISDFSSIEPFDYLICHGMLSWVSDELRDQLLHKIALLLSATGIAYISYNTDRIWSQREGIRQFIKSYDRRNQEVDARIRRARKVISLLGDTYAQKFHGISGAVLNEIQRLSSISDQLLLHEYMTEHFKTFSVAELAERFSSHGLMYLADARPRRNYLRLMCDLNPSLLYRTLHSAEASFGDQLLDHIEQHPFRAALFSKQVLKSKAAFEYQQLESLSISSALVPLSNTLSTEPQIFITGNENAVEVVDQRIKQALYTLKGLWPSVVPIAQLLEPPWTESMSSELAKLYWNHYIELNAGEISCGSTLIDKPHIPSYARLQARNGRYITTLRHEYFQANDFERMLLSLADGERTIEQISDIIHEAFEKGEIEVIQRDQRIDRELIVNTVRVLLGSFVERGLVSKSR